MTIFSCLIFETPPTWRSWFSYLYRPEQDATVIPQDTGVPFRRLLPLAGLRWKYSTPPPYWCCILIWVSCYIAYQYTRKRLLNTCIYGNVVLVSKNPFLRKRVLNSLPSNWSTCHNIFLQISLVHYEHTNYLTCFGVSWQSSDVSSTLIGSTVRIRNAYVYIRIYILKL
jgi:hypothetical protein